jgi:DNA-binding HxlR family transcriptional regulator
MSASGKKEIEQSTEELLCPIRYMLATFGGKWKQPIVCMLSGGTPTRYSTIKRKLTGITNMMLSQSLKELEASSVVHREQYNEVPPRVEYTLTEKGNSIVPILIQSVMWAVENMQSEVACGVYCDKCQSMNQSMK